MPHKGSKAMQSYKDGELVEVTRDEFVQSLYRHSGWADEEFNTRSDPAAHLGLLLAQAAADIDLLCAALRACSDDLEAEVEGRYQGVKDHPAMTPKYERDLEPVVNARKILNQ
jgi:hypothetical protein